MIELFPPLDFQVYMSKMKITAKKLVVWVSVTALFLLLLLLVTRRSGKPHEDTYIPILDVCTFCIGKGKYDLRPLNIKPGQVVLVTGAAGFIGSQVALTLATRWRAKVVGLDTFSEYYDVQLKMDRASELVQGGVHMYRGSVCDRSLLTLLFDKFNFSGVIHMAAQAGVRNSLKDPLHYLNNNVKCFTTLLELLKTRPVSCHGTTHCGCDGTTHVIVCALFRVSLARVSGVCLVLYCVRTPLPPPLLPLQHHIFPLQCVRSK